MTGRISWIAGVDWGKRQHQVCLRERGSGREVWNRRFNTDGRGLNRLLAALRERAGALLVAIAIERPDGPLVEMALDRGFLVFSINSRQSDRFRDRFSPSGAKDDRRDAAVLASALASDPAAFRQVRRPPALRRRLRAGARRQNRLSRDRVRLGQQVREELLSYWPELEALLKTGEATAPWFLALWSRIPTPERARRTRVATLDRLLKQLRLRRWSGAELKQLLSAQPVAVPAEVSEEAVLAIEELVQQIRLLNRQLRAVKERQLELLPQQQQAPAGSAPTRRPADHPPLAEQLLSLPGVGPTVAATLLGEAGELLDQGDANRLRLLAGTAPVTQRSGNSLRVRPRKAVNRHLRNAMFAWARVAVVHDPAMKAYFQKHRANGWATALRKVGDKQLRILAGMVKNKTLYDPQRALANTG